MTNSKYLLKKADLFERLAIYGGTRAFQSFGQDFGKAVDQDMFSQARKLLQLAKDETHRLDEDWQDWMVKYYPSMGTAPQDVASLKAQLSDLTKIRNILYSKAKETNDSKLSNTALGIGKYLLTIENLVNTLSPAAAKPDVGSESFAPEGRSAVEVFSINPNVQRALNKLFNLKLAPDGVLGPQTANAIQMFKNKFNNTKHFSDRSLHQDILDAV